MLEGGREFARLFPRAAGEVTLELALTPLHLRGRSLLLGAQEDDGTFAFW